MVDEEEDEEARLVGPNEGQFLPVHFRIHDKFFIEHVEWGGGKDQHPNQEDNDVFLIGRLDSHIAKLGNFLLLAKDFQRTAGIFQRSGDAAGGWTLWIFWIF